MSLPPLDARKSIRIVVEVEVEVIIMHLMRASIMGVAQAAQVITIAVVILMEVTIVAGILVAATLEEDTFSRWISILF